MPLSAALAAVQCMSGFCLRAFCVPPLLLVRSIRLLLGLGWECALRRGLWRGLGFLKLCDLQLRALALGRGCFAGCRCTAAAAAAQEGRLSRLC